MLADLAGAIDEVFITAKFCQAHGAAGVELVGADADLGSEPKLAAVIEAGAGIVHDHGAVCVRQLAQEFRQCQGESPVVAGLMSGLHSQRLTFVSGETKN